MLLFDHKATLKSENHVFSPIQVLLALVKDSEAFQQDSARGGENYETNVSPFASWEYVRTCYYDAKKGDHRTRGKRGARRSEREERRGRTKRFHTGYPLEGSGARDSYRHARHAKCVFILLLLLLLRIYIIIIIMLL